LARSIVGKAVSNLLIGAANGVSGRPDDTAAAVAIWSFLHGYGTLEHSGAFGSFRVERWNGAGHGSLLEQLPQPRRACSFLTIFRIRSFPETRSCAESCRPPAQRPTTP
jgi:hypothetical protein